MFDIDFYNRGYALVTKYNRELSLLDEETALGCVRVLGERSPYTWDHWSAFKQFRYLIKPYATKEELKEMTSLFWKTAALRLLLSGVNIFFNGLFLGAGCIVLLKLVSLIL